MTIENEVADLVVRGVSRPALLFSSREPGSPPDTTLFSISSKYQTLLSLEVQERVSSVPETRIRGSATAHPTRHRPSRRLKQEPIRARGLVYDGKASGPLEALWDGHRQIEEWHEVGHGAGRKEKGHFYTRDLGGQLLEQARFTRRGGRTTHASENDDWDEWDDDEDRRGSRGGAGPPRPKLNHVRWYHGNMLGTTSLITNYRGRVLDRFETGPWGEPLEGNFKKAVYGFTGHRWEQAAGHWSSLNRYLDPRAGRWTQRDSAGRIDGENRYAYASSSPISRVDELGLFAYSFDSIVFMRPSVSDTWMGYLTLKANFSWQLRAHAGPSAERYYGFIQITKVVKDGKVDTDEIRNPAWMDPTTGYAVDTDDLSTPLYGDPGTGQGEWKRGGNYLNDTKAGIEAGWLSSKRPKSEYSFEAQTYVVSDCNLSTTGSVDAIDGWSWGYKYTLSDKKLKVTDYRRLRTLTPTFDGALKRYLATNPWKGAPLNPSFYK